MYDLDLVVDSGCGEQAVREYVGDSRKYGARRAIYRARQRANPLMLSELRDITEMWVETTVKLTRALPDHVESRERKGIAQLQRVGACPDGKSRATFSGHALEADLRRMSHLQSAQVRRLRRGAPLPSAA